MRRPSRYWFSAGVATPHRSNEAGDESRCVVAGVRPAVERGDDRVDLRVLLYSLVVVRFAAEGVKTSGAPTLPWYPSKRQPSFADMVATLERNRLEEGLFSHLSARRLRKRVHRALVCAAQIAA